jgi:hypothetical protein
MSVPPSTTNNSVSSEPQFVRKPIERQPSYGSLRKGGLPQALVDEEAPITQWRNSQLATSLDKFNVQEGLSLFSEKNERLYDAFLKLSSFGAM